MADKELVITHLQIIHTWADFARERDLQFFTKKHLKDIAQWSEDAINLLKEQVSVVLCMDCKHWIPGTIDDNDNFNQPRCKRNGGGWSADEYCSNAEGR